METSEDMQMPQRRDTTELSERHNVTLPPVISRAGNALAAHEGRKFSQLVQELIRDRARAVFGPNWRERFSDNDKEQAA